MRHAATVVGVVGLMLVSFAPPARADRTDASAGAGAVGALAGIVCWTTVIATGEDGEPEDGYARRGFMLGASGVYGVDNFDSEEQTARRTAEGASLDLSLANIRDSWGVKGRVSYRCHRRLSIEVEAEWLGGFNGKVYLEGSKIGSYKVEPVVVTSSFKGHILTGRYQPFLFAGAGVMTARTQARDASGPRRYLSDRDTEFTFRFGGGIDIYVTEHVVVTLGADYVMPVADLEPLDYISIDWGFQYRF